MSESTKCAIPVHQWTHDGEHVLFLRCCNADGTGYGGYAWPAVGEIATPEQWDPSPVCGNGLHGWPWGTAFGDGKDPQYDGLWIVFEAIPADVVCLGGKCKVRECRIVYRGTYQEAISKLLPGYHAWVLQASSGASSATGDRGASSATGYSGASSATGYSGASSATGDRGASSATGDRGAATITGEYATIEVGPNAIGCATSTRFYWRVRHGAWLACRVDGDAVLFQASKFEDGSLVCIENCKVVDKFSY